MMKNDTLASLALLSKSNEQSDGRKKKFLTIKKKQIWSASKNKF